ncbi:MAG: radical SAM protein [Rhodopirellula sp.]|nr:radical SAM protein [Rhodopirellula sp.]
MFASLNATTDSREELLRLLQDTRHPDRREDVYRQARAVVREHLGNRGRIWAAIGLDQAPCDMGCRFCSFASEWTQFNEPQELSIEESLQWAEDFIGQRADYLILRTSEQYSLEKLLDLGRRIADRKPDTVRLVANTRLANETQLSQLKEAGFHGIYKTIRVREGVDTAFDPAVRLKQIRQARDHGLRVFGLVEPVGPEHSDEEIIDAMLLLRDEVHTGLVGAMARVPVVGSPLYGCGAVDAQRLAAITAVFILAMADHFEDVEVVCSHPPHPEILRAGASAVVVEVGAIPRDTAFAEREWRGLTMPEARKLLQGAGYEV